MGVFAPLVGIVGTMQAAEALKLLCGLGSKLTGRLLMVDGRDMAFTSIALPRHGNCSVCGLANSAP
ncbi:MAG: ThiF family adenylyltransferase, partial [Hydrogenophaga sp.]